MGPFQEDKVKKTFGRANTRSRIPRLILKPVRPEDSQMSDFPLSEDKTKDCDVSHKENRTISPNSFSSDDTGCPSSQCPSPAKIRSGSENSSLASPIPVKSKAKVKRVRVSAAAECNGNIQKHKREKQHPPVLQRGSEADFSSSSSTGSLKSHGTKANNSTGKKSCLSYSRVPHIRNQPICKSPGSPTVLRDTLCKTSPRKPHSSCSSNNSGPTMRRPTSGRYHSCGDNHGIRPPNPEQYLTPLQQKEVAIRHLKTQLKDSEQTISDRESEIQELKSQLDRMREDWIEEECHRVEAQLSLKEARKEIKQLRQVVETMKNSLMEKDKGIQKYFIDINIQNRKLESLLHSMELAQSGINLHDEPTLDFICNSPEKLVDDEQKGELEVEDPEVEEGTTDSRMLVNDEIANQMDTVEHILMSTAVDSSQDGNAKILSQPGLSTLTQGSAEDSVKSSEEQIHSQTSFEQHACGEKAVQTDETFYNPDLQALLLHLLKLQNTGLSSNVLQKLPKAHESNIPLAEEPNSTFFQAQSPKLVVGMDHVFDDPALSPILIPQDPGGSTQSLESHVDPRVMEELDVGMMDACSHATAVVGKNHWSNSFLVDLFAVAAPVVPMVTWLYSQHNAGDGAPEYNVGALFRGCCTMGLHSLRLVTYGPHV